MSCDKGLVVVDVDNPLKPQVVATLPLAGAGHSAIQFRYAFVCGSEGITVLDVTDLRKPVKKTLIPMKEAKDIYLARTKAYVAAGHQGLAIIDIENPEKPGAPRFYDAGGKLNDAHAVKVGMTNASLFAYVADGKNGLRVVELMTPVKTPGLWGFSPEVEPKLIATYKTRVRRWHCLRVWTGIAEWMRVGTNWWCLRGGVVCQEERDGEAVSARWEAVHGDKRAALGPPQDDPRVKPAMSRRRDEE